MKKYIAVAALLVAGSAFSNATTPTDVDGSITLDGTQATDTRLDFKYSTNSNQSLVTTIDSVTIEGADGYGLGTENISLLFDIKYQLTATGTIKLPTSASSSTWTVNTNLTDAERSAFETDRVVSRMVVNADFINNISAFVTNDHINCTLGNLTGLADGGLLFVLGSDYYATSDITFANNYATIRSGATAVSLEDGTLYTLAKITAASGASVKGIGFIATIPEPSAFGLLAGAGALALVASRRRRHR